MSLLYITSLVVIPATSTLLHTVATRVIVFCNQIIQTVHYLHNSSVTITFHLDPSMCLYTIASITTISPPPTNQSNSVHTKIHPHRAPNGHMLTRPLATHFRANHASHSTLHYATAALQFNCRRPNECRPLSLPTGIFNISSSQNFFDSGDYHHHNHHQRNKFQHSNTSCKY